MNKPQSPSPQENASEGASERVGETTQPPHYPSLPATCSAGVRYGRFALQRFHAKGGLGEVHIATDEELRRDVALKRMQDRCAHDPAARRRFLNEAEITARLEHPGIVPIYGFVHDDAGQPCYAMRFIEGESLAEAIRRFHRSPPRKDELPGNNEPRHKDEPPDKDEPPGSSRRAGGDKPRRSSDFSSLAFRQLLARFISVCNTIAYAHSKRVIHRDIKPANIMLGPFGETLVVDWGLARETSADTDGGGEVATPSAEEDPHQTTLGFTPSTSDERVYTQAGQALGTLGYMAPEQAAGRWKRVGPRSDVYSLGATLYEMLTGNRPIRGPTPSEAFQHALTAEFPPPRTVNPEMPRALEAVCLKAMATKPENRYATAEELAADLEHWLADEPVTACPERLAIQARRWSRKHPRIVSSLAATLLVGMVALGAGLVAVEHERQQTASERDEKGKALAAVTVAREDEKLARKQTRQVNRITEGLIIELFAKQEKRPDPVWQQILQSMIKFKQLQFTEIRTDPAEHHELANYHYWLGMYYRRTDQPEKQRAAWLNSVAVSEAAPADPDPVTEYGYLSNRGRTYYNLGVMAHLQEHAAESADWSAKAIAVLQPLFEQNVPNSDTKWQEQRNEVKWFLAEASVILGTSLLDLERYEEAVPHLRRGLALGSRPKPEEVRLHCLAKALAHLGNYEEGIREAETSFANLAADGENCYALAEVYALAAQPAGSENRPQHYATKAVSLLLQANAKGYFNDAETLKKFRASKIFAPLRGRDEFQALLKELEEKKQP